MQTTTLKSGANYQNQFLNMAQLTYIFIFDNFWLKLHSSMKPIKHLQSLLSVLSFVIVD